jgi:FlaA1/EpsC-like NDP-sugar epimerase
LLTQFHNRRFFIIVAADMVIFVISIIGAYLIRFDFVIYFHYRQQIFQLLPLLIPGKVALFFFYGMYRGMWRYTTINDLGRLAQASLLTGAIYLIATPLVFGLQGVPLSIFLIDAILSFTMSSGLRVGIRIFYMARAGKTWWPFSTSKAAHSRVKEKSFLVVGAGAAGEKMHLEILENRRFNHRVVGFLDDDRSKWGRSLHRTKVFGGIELLPEVVEREGVDEVLIAIPTATGEQMRRITELCKGCDIHYRTLPEIGAIIDGMVSIKNLRDVRYEDLLRRPPVELDNAEISKYLQGKKVMVTGAGGSIGSELCRQIIRFHPAELLMIDASEPNLFNIQMQLQHELNFESYQCILGRVQNRLLMDDVFNSHRPQVVFHASAYKHVPMLEKNPWEAIYNNVLGTQVMMDMALKFGAERFVLVSTDKAVRPTNVMGASKRLAELILQSRQGNGTCFMAVRFGNVVGSSGSVVPLFQRQLEHGGPITVTHPKVTRFFMTIHEAAQLILQAGGLGEGGEIFILKMGTPVNIAKMAEELVRLSGKEPGKDVNIIFTGLREGEKLFEELIAQDEDIVGTKHDKILVLRSNGWNGKNNRSEFTGWLNEAIGELSRIADSHDSQAIRNKLREIIPEYLPQRDVKSVLEPTNSKRVPAPPSEPAPDRNKDISPDSAPLLKITPDL